MEDVSEKVIKHLNEVCTEISDADDNLIQFFKILDKVTIEEVEEAKQDMLRAVKRMKNNRLHEDVTDDARDYILSGKSKFGSDIKFERVTDTLEKLEKHYNDNYRELLMYFNSIRFAQLKELYHFHNWQFSLGVTDDDIPYIDFVIPENLKELLCDDLKQYGLVGRNKPELIKDYVDYFPILYQNSINISDKFDGWTYVRFCPVAQKDVRKIIRNNSQYVYHITDAASIDSIEKNGIQLRNMSHPEVKPRIFLFVDNRNDVENNDFWSIDDYFVGLVKRIHQYRLKDGITKEKNPYKWKFVLLTIDIDKIPTDVEFYWDLYSFPYAFFTEDSIPIDAVVDYEIMQIKPTL